MKVLYIDDEPDILEQAEIFLEKADDSLDVKTCRSGQKALDLIKEAEDFEVIVSDYKMTGLDGLDLLERIREKNDEIPFLFLSGKVDRELKNKALNSGADEFIQKKGSPRKMYKKVSDTISEIVEK